jgi:cation diffusion facilitator family transporter
LTQKSSKEKSKAAVSSVIAAIFLTAFKLTIGIVTGSLGILSEAAHSGFDLVAAAMTMFAVKAGDKPADAQHHYGHGKFENLSALFETLLLLLTCVLIGNEAIRRLLFKKVEIDVTIWSFVVMFTSIVIDFSRSRMLFRTAKKYHSQALEADALHFSTDILSSAVVIVGLVGAKFGLEFADPIASLGVAAIVVFISFRLGKRTVDVLVDKSPESTLVADIRAAVLSIREVEEVKSLRVRVSGGKIFVDTVVELPRLLPFERAHALVDEIESKVRSVRDGIDVVVHAEPVKTDKETVVDKIKFAAENVEGNVHEIEVFSTKKGFVVDLHLEVTDAETIESAHHKADILEAAIRKQVENVDHVFIHIDKPTLKPKTAKTLNLRASDLPEKLLDYVKGRRGVVGCGNMNFAESDSGIRVAMICQFDETLSLEDTVKMVNELEVDIVKKFPKISRVVIHQEPITRR